MNNRPPKGGSRPERPRPAPPTPAPPAGALAPEEAQQALRPFRGAIRQTPPDYSAIKIQGKRACDRVRDGETVALAARDVFVHALEMTGWEAGSGAPASASEAPVA